MKYDIEMVSGAMIYIPTFINIVSGIQKLIRGWGFTNTQKQTAWRSHKPTFIFFFNKGRRLKWIRGFLLLGHQ
jgi:hypothetical protein